MHKIRSFNVIDVIKTNLAGQTSIYQLWKMAQRTNHRTCELALDSEILLQVLRNPNLRTVYYIFLLYILVLLYLLVFKWNLKSPREIKWYMPRIRRHLAIAMGTSSVVLGISGITTAESDCILARLSVSSSCTLSFLAVFCAYGYSKRPNELIGISISLASLALCIPSMRTFHMVNSSDYINLRLIFGSYHLLMGLLLYLSGEAQRYEGIPWHSRNGNLPQMMN